MLADWLVTLDKVRGAGPKRRAAAEAALRARIVYEGTRLDLVDRKAAPWWMMVSDDEMALKALLAAIGRSGWAADAPRMMIGAGASPAARPLGHDPGQCLGDDRRPAVRGGLSGRRGRHDHGAAGERDPDPDVAAPADRRPGAGARADELRPAGPARLAAALAQRPADAVGDGVGARRGAAERRRPSPATGSAARSPSSSASGPTRSARGDVLKVRIIVEAPVDRTWVVIEDPVPAGASIISGGGGQSALLAGQAQGGDGWPSYIERGNDAWRAYFGWLPQGRTSVEYALRINGAGPLPAAADPGRGDVFARDPRGPAEPAAGGAP